MRTTYGLRGYTYTYQTPEPPGLGFRVPPILKPPCVIPPRMENQMEKEMKTGTGWYGVV